MLFLLFVFMLLDIVFPVSYYLTTVLVFINKTISQVAGAAILTIRGMKTACNNREQMEDRPVFTAIFQILQEGVWSFMFSFLCSWLAFVLIIVQNTRKYMLFKYQLK